MLARFWQRFSSVASAFVACQRGSILIYTGAFMVIGVGGAAISIDIGRVVLLKTELQNRADAGALGGAAQLDGKKDAITRASFVMQKTMEAFTNSIADQTLLDSYAPTFYLVHPSAKTNPAFYTVPGPLTVDGMAARFARFTMKMRTLSFFYAPAVGMMSGAAVSNVTYVDATALAMSDPFICKVQPLMICDPFDDGFGGVTADLLDPAYIGKSVAIKKPNTGGGTWTAGNFGLLQLPTDAAYGVGGANAIAAALNSEDPQGCYAMNVLTQPGSMTVKVEDAINTRFDVPLGSKPPPAPNVINYPKDATWQISGVLGNKDWPIAAYWAARHPGMTMPAIMDGATRYQMYLFELGQTFYRKKSGKDTATYLDPTVLSGGGWDTVVPQTYYAGANLIPVNAAAPNDNWSDGVPSQASSAKGADRRMIRVALMACLSAGVKGNGTYPSSGRYIEIFLTEQSPDPSAGGGIFGEIVRALNPRTSLEYHGNVRLIE